MRTTLTLLCLVALVGSSRIHAQTAAQPPVAPKADAGGSTLNSQPASTTNYVLVLDGTNSFVELPPNIFNDLTEATVEAWVRWDDFGGGFNRVFNYGDALRDMTIASWSTTTLGFGVAGPTGTLEDLHPLRVDGLLRPRQWCHVAAVSGKGGMRLYFNGTLVGTNAYTGSFSAFKNGTRNYLGKGVTTNDPPANLKGAMDEVRVWKVARTAEQIRESLGRRLTGSEEGLVGLWNFDDQANAGRDASPGAHHGKLMGRARVVEADLPRPEALPLPAFIDAQLAYADGSPANEVEVRLERGGQQFVSATTDVSGHFRVGSFALAQPFELVATDLDLGLRERQDPLKPGEQRTVKLVFREAVSLAGRTVALDSSPLPGVVVELIPATSAGLPITPTNRPGRYRWAMIEV